MNLAASTGQIISLVALWGGVLCLLVLYYLVHSAIKRLPSNAKPCFHVTKIVVDTPAEFSPEAMVTFELHLASGQTVRRRIEASKTFIITASTDADAKTAHELAEFNDEVDTDE